LLGNGAAANNCSSLRQIIIHGLLECDQIKAIMLIKAAVFCHNHRPHKMLGYACKGNGPPAKMGISFLLALSFVLFYKLGFWNGTTFNAPPIRPDGGDIKEINK